LNYTRISEIGAFWTPPKLLDYHTTNRNKCQLFFSKRKKNTGFILVFILESMPGRKAFADGGIPRNG